MCEVSHLATNFSLDPERLEKAIRVSGEKTKKAAVTTALKEFVSRHGQNDVSRLFRKLQWDKEFDRKKNRSRK